MVDPRYHQNIIGSASSGDIIHDQTVAKTIINVMLHDCTKRVSMSPKRKNSQGFIHVNTERSISVRNHKPFFIKEKARKIRPKLTE